MFENSTNRLSLLPGGFDDGRRQHTGELPAIGCQGVQQGHVVCLHLDTLGERGYRKAEAPHASTCMTERGSSACQPQRAERGRVPCSPEALALMMLKGFGASRPTRTFFLGSYSVCVVGKELAPTD